MSSENGRMTILLVGSSPTEAGALRKLIMAEADSYALEHVGDLDVAFTRLAQNHVHILLLDLSAPRDPKLASFLRARRHATELPMVVLADPADERLAVEAVQKGAQDYLIKGRVDHAQLLHVVRSAIERQRLLGQIESTIRALQASELNFNHVIESHFDGMVVVDQGRVVQFVNPAAEALLDRSIQELIGKPFTGPIVPDKTEEYVVVSGGKVVRTVELRTVHTIWEGQSAFLVSLRDISERKRVEQLKDEFVSKVSHELRTPLTSIKGTVTLMLNKALGPINEEQQDFLQTVGQDIDRLAELINNLLDLSKIEAGKMVVNRQPLELASVVDQVCRSYHTILGERHVVKPSTPVPSVYADRNLIVQVISNLVGNAVKFTAADGTITFTLKHVGDQVALTIGDNGPGIPQESCRKLFQKFVQADGPAENQPKGTGLGLAISREIVELHQGEIYVESEVGKGTDFTFTLPVHDPGREFDKQFETLKGEASVFSLLLVDLADFKSLSSEIEKVVVGKVANRDHVLMVEPTLLAVLAGTDSRGSEVMRQRLAEGCTAWLTQHGVQAPRVQIASATYPAEGESAAVLMKQAKAKLRKERSDEA